MEFVLNTAILLSNWYSGATLLSLLLDSNPDIVCNGETFPFGINDTRRHNCSCGEYIDQCDFYKNTTNINPDFKFPDNWDYEFAIVNPKFHRNKLLNRFLSSPVRDSEMRDALIKYLNISSDIESFVDKQLEFMKNAISYQNAKLYIDGTKSIRRAQLLAKYSSLEKIKVIHLIRDGRAFCNSYRKNQSISEDNLIQAAIRWNDYISLVDQLENRFKNIEVMHIRYEDICNFQDSTLQSIVDFLPEDLAYKFGKSGVKAHILGNRMRTNFDFKIVEDLSWKKEIKKTTTEVITKKMKDNLKRFSYI